MAIHSEYNRNGALVFYEDHLARIVDAVGSNVIKYVADSGEFQQNGDSGTDPRGWTATVVEAGTGTSEGQATREAGATFELVTAAAENDGINIQRNGEIYEFTSDQHVYFGIRLKINDVDQSDFLVGLGITDTTPLAGLSDAVYFRSVDASADVATVTEKDSSETENTGVVTMSDDTYVTLEFYFDGSTVYFYVDGSEVASHTADIPDDEALRPTLHFLTGEGAAQTMTVQWLRVIQMGR